MKRLRREHIEREIEEELRFHLEMRAHQNRTAGMSTEAAEADAHQRFGDFEAVKSQCREITKERLAHSPARRILSTLIWLMTGSGLTLRFLSDVHSVQQCGEVLVMISLTWRLLLYLRLGGLARKPEMVHASSTFPLVTIAPEEPRRAVDYYDGSGRTPVERILSDD